MADGAEPGRLTGRLLVATPGLADPNFARTVVLIVEHNDEGAAGIVLNRSSDTELGGPLEGLRPLAAPPSTVFIGGPVSTDAAVCLGTVAGPTAEVPGWQSVVGSLGVVDLGADVDALVGCVDRLRVFAGYAGWESGQLERELDEGAWYVVDAAPEDAMASDPSGLWRDVLRRQGGKLAMVAGFPDDPAMN